MVTLKNSLQAAGTKALAPALAGQDGLRGLSLRRLYPVWFTQAAKFVLVGILNTAVDVGLYLVLTRWFGVFARWRVVAKGISYGAGILNSFYWNRSWTFKMRAGVAAFVAFVAANLMAMAINAGVMYLSLNRVGLPEGPALALATGTAFVWNFTICKWFVFRKRSRRKGYN
ncbi:MAG: GtrA family protein [Bacillota bacterium]|nr:GtrA family protein [Bacillota bacterium]